MRQRKVITSNFDKLIKRSHMNANAIVFQKRPEHSTGTHIPTTGREVCPLQQECPGAGAGINLLTDQESKDLDSGNDIHTASDSLWRTQLLMTLNI